jgi:hypothetical protein
MNLYQRTWIRVVYPAFNHLTAKVLFWAYMYIDKKKRKQSNSSENQTNHVPPALSLRSYTRILSKYCSAAKAAAAAAPIRLHTLFTLCSCLRGEDEGLPEAPAPMMATDLIAMAAIRDIHDIPGNIVGSCWNIGI